jgi:hypothetical protein
MEFQNMFHPLNELWREFWNTPTSYCQDLSLFFSRSRTVSGEISVAMPSFNAPGSVTPVSIVLVRQAARNKPAR